MYTDDQLDYFIHVFNNPYNHSDILSRLLPTSMDNIKLQTNCRTYAIFMKIIKDENIVMALTFGELDTKNQKINSVKISHVWTPSINNFREIKEVKSFDIYNSGFNFNPRINYLTVSNQPIFQCSLEDIYHILDSIWDNKIDQDKRLAQENLIREERNLKAQHYKLARKLIRKGLTKEQIHQTEHIDFSIIDSAIKYVEKENRHHERRQKERQKRELIKRCKSELESEYQSKLDEVYSWYIEESTKRCGVAIQPPRSRYTGSKINIETDDFNQPLELLDLSVRVFNRLKRYGITTIGELLRALEEGTDSMLAIPNFGHVSLAEVKTRLKEQGYITDEKEKSE